MDSGENFDYPGFLQEIYELTRTRDLLHRSQTLYYHVTCHVSLERRFLTLQGLKPSFLLCFLCFSPRIVNLASMFHEYIRRWLILGTMGLACQTRVWSGIMVCSRKTCHMRRQVWLAGSCARVIMQVAIFSLDEGRNVSFSPH